jgi:nicotinamidase/pyrazinamidase
MTTALVVVDMQNAFVAPDGGAAVDGAERVVAAVNQRVAAAGARGWPTFYTRDVDPTGRRGPAADHDTALHPGLDVRGIVVDKGPGSAAGFSGFALASTAAGGTPGGGGLSALAGLLREAATDRVLVVGLAADVCVAATARDARRLGYATAIDLDATAFVHAHPDGDDAALADLRAAGVRLEHSTE